MGGSDNRNVTPLDITRYAWGRRAMESDPSFIQNEDSSRSTHRMAAEVDNGGNWWAFPTIVRTRSGDLKQFNDHESAMKWNIDHGQAIPFGQDKDSALNFASGVYKQGTPLEGNFTDALFRLLRQ